MPPGVPAPAATHPCTHAPTTPHPTQLAAYGFFTAWAWRELARRPYAPYRVANIELRLQLATRVEVAVGLVVATTLLW